MMWPRLEAQIESARKIEAPKVKPARALEEKVEEILVRVRDLTGYVPAVSATDLSYQFLSRLRQDKNRGLLCSFVESGKLVEVANGVAVLAFPPDADFARDSCAGKNRKALEELLSELAGQPIALKCETRKDLG